MNEKWGKQGTRYDEACDGCHRDSEVDNNSGLCQRCHGMPTKPKIDTSVAEPYRRGIGQGFGSTEDGQL